MFTQVTRILTNQPSNVLQDAIGVAAIFVVLFVGLSLPGMS